MMPRPRAEEELKVYKKVVLRDFNPIQFQKSRFTRNKLVWLGHKAGLKRKRKICWISFTPCSCASTTNVLGTLQRYFFRSLIHYRTLAFVKTDLVSMLSIVSIVSV